MVHPIDYAGRMNIPNPLQAGLTGLQQGMQIQDMRAQRQDREQQRQRAMQMQTDLAAFAEQESKTPDDYANIMIRYPELSQEFKTQMSALSEPQRRARLSQAQQVYSSMQSGDIDYANKVLDEQAEAFRNSGDEQMANQIEGIKTVLEINPGAAEMGAGMFLQAMGGSKALQMGGFRQSQILPDGTIVGVTRAGDVVVKDSANNQITDPDKIKDAIDTAKQYGIDVAGKKTGAITRTKTEEQRANELITRGIAAAESTATLRRGLDLLNIVKTGGWRSAALRAKQAFGVEGANEGELSANLGKAVLSQLRETFGAAFTENEGKRLERIEGSFGKSNKTNIRLVNNALKIAERNAKRAMRAAEKRKDMDTVNDIQELLSFSLSEDSTTTDQPEEQIPNITTKAQYDALPSGSQFVENGKRYRKP